MSGFHSLSGLMKWLRRDPWREAFEDALDLHLGPACDKAGIETDQLADLIGDDLTATLWGCAFEDFLTRDVDGSGNVVDDYIKRRGWNEKAPNKAYMAGLRSSVMSLYEVSDVRAGESLLARDLFRGGEPVRVSERTATRTLKQWDRIAARLVEVRGKVIFGGGLLPFDHELAESLLTSLRRTRKRAAKDGAEFLRDLDCGIGPAEIDEAFGDTAVLCLAAPLFSTVWLNDALDRVLNPRLPEIRNSDGDEMVFVSLHYPLRPGVAARRVREALDRLPDVHAESMNFWNWLAHGGAPLRQPRSKASSGLASSSMLDDGSLARGTLELKGKELLLSVNSENRAERGRAMLAPVLEGLVGEPLVERQDLAQAMAERAANTIPAVPSDIPDEEERRIVHESLDRHYRRQLDEPIPMLDDLSPRQATKSAKGREKVVAWLKQLENHMARHEPPDPMAGYDTAWLWEELGLAEFRE
jgi:hypothetical protein